MTRPGVFLSEVDISTTFDNNSSFYVGAQLKALKGDQQKVLLINRPLKLLKEYTPDETIKIGYDDNFWNILAILEKAKAMVSRVSKNTGFSACKIYSRDYEDFSGANNFSGQIKYNALTNDFSSLDTKITKTIQTGQAITFNTGTLLPAPLVANTTYYIVKTSLTKFKLAATQVDALATTPTIITLTPVVQSAVVTVAPATDIFTVGSNVLDNLLQLGNIGHLTVSGGTLMSPLQENINYYIIRISDTQFKLATTLANATANTAIDITTAGSGTITFNIVKDLTVHNIKLPMSISNTLSAEFTANATTDEITMTTPIINHLITTASEVKFSVSGGSLPSPLQPNTYYYLIEQSAGIYKIAIDSDNAIADVFINLTDVGSGTMTMTTKLKEPQSYNFLTNEALLFYPKDGGIHGDALAIGIEDNSSKEPDTFKVLVYKLPDLTTPIEDPFICSRIVNKKDGYNRNIYVENVMKQSQYVRCNNNELIDETVPPLFQVTPIRLRGGNDGDTITEGDLILDLNAKFKNPNTVPMTVFIDGAYTYPNYQKEILKIAKLRNDCVGLLGVPLEHELNSDYLNAVVDYKTTTLNANSSYGGIYSPHVKIYDAYNSREDLMISPTGYIAALIGETDANLKRWFPVAGKRRGVFNTISGLVREYDEDEQDYLYDNGVNPIILIQGEGIFLYGQKTLLNRASALDRMNVRLLLTVLEPATKKFLDNYVFEFNDQPTRDDILAGLNSYYTGVKSDRGLYDFLIVCSDVNNDLLDIDQYRLNVWIFIKPNKAAEFIPTKMVITRTDMSFSLAQQLIV